jgi:hypothetical protein
MIMIIMIIMIIIIIIIYHECNASDSDHSNCICQMMHNSNQLLHSEEPLQVVRYNVGEYYREHFDNKEGATVIKRAATLIM